MTADERIEKLLNRFGQTISDLPKANGTAYAYDYNTKKCAVAASINFAASTIKSRHLTDYICHLADVIDRMEIALETAARWAECSTCAIECTAECEKGVACNYRICDSYLYDDVTVKEMKALDEDH